VGFGHVALHDSAAAGGGGMMTDFDFMQIALGEARLAGEAGEVPIGAVIVRDREIVARGQNRVLREMWTPRPMRRS
jgi:hypothetical protein